jgi:hypothetical protein
VVYALNLPPADLTTKKEGGKVWIFDVIRKKYVHLTPEEWVRQHVIHFFIHGQNYPRALLRIEGSLHYNRLQKRSDIVVCNREGKPWLLAECKAPTVKLSQKAFNQVSVYNLTVGARYLAVTNGLLHFCWQAGAAPQFLSGFPAFET